MAMQLDEQPWGPVDELANVLLLMKDFNLNAHRRQYRFGWIIAPGKIRPMGLVAARMSINPFEFFLLFATVFTALAYALGGTWPSSIQSLMPTWGVRLWAYTLLVGALTCAFGGLNRRALDKSLALYQFGWGLLGTACVIYSIAVLSIFGLAGLFSGVFILAFSLAAWFRVAQVQQFFNLADSMIRASSAVRAADQIVQFSRDAIIGKSLDGTIVSWNLAAERLYGYFAAEILGLNAAILFPPERRDEELHLLACAADGDTVEDHHTERVHKDGTLIPVTLTISPITAIDGTVVGVASVSRQT